MKTQNILLVEDSEDDFILLRRAFKQAGVTIPMHWVSDGQQAIDYLAGKDAFADRTVHPLPSIILMDIKMPYKTGFEVLAWLRQEAALKTVPVLMLTSSNDENDRAKAEKLGANAYLVKPSSIDALIGVVKNVAAEWLK